MAARLYQHKKRSEEDVETEATPPRKVGAAETIGVGVGLETMNEPREVLPPPPLSEEDAATFALLVQHFGVDQVQFFRSPRYQDRLQFVRILVEESEQAPPEQPENSLTTRSDFRLQLLSAVSALVADPVLHVFSAAATHLVDMINQSPELLHDPGVEPVVALTACTLVDRLKDGNARIRDISVNALLTVAQQMNGGAERVLTQLCQDSNGPSEGAKALLPKIDLASTLCVKEPPLVSKCSAMLAKLGVRGLVSTNPQVRKRASTFVTQLYRVLGKEVDAYIVGVSAATMKILRSEIESETCAAAPLDDAAQKREEDEDLAAMEADGQPSEAQAAVAARWNSGIKLRSLPCVFSSRWKVRERLANRLCQNVTVGGSCIDFKDSAAVSCLAEVEVKLLQDTVPAIVSVALSLVKLTIPHVLEPLFPPYVTVVLPHLVRCFQGIAAPSPLCRDIILTIARRHQDGAAMVSRLTVAKEHLSQDVCKAAPRIVIPRLELLTLLVTEFECRPPRGVPLDTFMKFALDGLQHPQSKVRTVAGSLVIGAYRVAGKEVLTHLQGVKGPLLDELKLKLQSTPRKDRTSTAPQRHLATIVEPLFADSDARPATGEIKEYTSKRETIRQRIQKWNESNAQLRAEPSSAEPSGEQTSEFEEDTEESGRLISPQPSLAQTESGSLRSGTNRRGKLMFS